MGEEKKKSKNIWQFVKFALFSASAGIIQVVSFTLISEFVIKLPFFENLMKTNDTFAKIMQNEYGPMYLIALILSVLWNFTFNRKFTFKSAANIPIAMLKVFAFYLVFVHFSHFPYCAQFLDGFFCTITFSHDNGLSQETFLQQPTPLASSDFCIRTVDHTVFFYIVDDLIQFRKCKSHIAVRRAVINSNFSGL